MELSWQQRTSVHQHYSQSERKIQWQSVSSWAWSLLQEAGSGSNSVWRCDKSYLSIQERDGRLNQHIGLHEGQWGAESKTCHHQNVPRRPHRIVRVESPDETVHNRWVRMFPLKLFIAIHCSTENIAHAPTTTDSHFLIASWTHDLNKTKIYKMLTQLKISPANHQWMISWHHKPE